MEKKQFDELRTKLDNILKLLAITVLHGKSTKDQTITLVSYGFKPAEIAKILGKPLANITSYISKSKKKNEGIK